MDKNEGYNWLRAFVVALTFVFQVVLLFSSPSLTSYLLSNISILSGYCLDLYVTKQNERSLYKLMWVTIWVEFISLVSAFGDIMYIAEFSGKNNLNEIVEALFKTLVPALTILAMALYLLICILLLIRASKNRNCFTIGE